MGALNRFLLISTLLSTPLLALTVTAAARTESTTPAPAFDEKDPLLVEVRSEPGEWNVGQAGRLVISMKLPAKYHAYEDKFALEILEPDGFLVAPAKVAPVHEFYDKFSKKTRRAVSERSEMIVNIEAPARWADGARDQMVLHLTYQACSDSFCLFPTTKTITTPLRLIHAKTANAPEQVAAPKPTSVSSLLSSENLTALLGTNLFLSLLLVFIAGILTSFTPCIFPMIPITLAVLGHHAESRTRAQNFLLSLSYVHGIALTYSLMGVLAASSGAVFGASLGNPWIVGAVCVLFFVMALSMYGLFEIQVPAFLRNTLGTKRATPGYLGAFVTGMIAGVVASPCVGPVLVTILAWVATSGSKVYGFILLFTYAMGLGLIFLFLGVFTEFRRRLPRSGPWLETIKFILGSLMLGAFYYYLGLLLPARWHDGALGIGLVTLGSLAGAHRPLKGTTALQKIQKGFAQALLAIGIGYFALAAFDLRPALNQKMIDPSQSTAAAGFDWQPYSDAAIEQAKKDHKPVLIDFWADWCAACHELEENTFPDKRVRALAGGFVALKYDATSDSPQLRELKAKWKIQGLPTVLFINPNGVWLETLTLTEFETPDRFASRMEKALN